MEIINKTNLLDFLDKALPAEKFNCVLKVEYHPETVSAATIVDLQPEQSKIKKIDIQIEL